MMTFNRHKWSGRTADTTRDSKRSDAGVFDIIRIASKAVSSFWLCAALVVPVIVESAPINTDETDLAIKGYDVVAYFIEGHAVKGNSEFEYSWQNARWRFSTATYRDLFAANPERYVPQYGGFCAQCLVERGRFMDVNPKAWTIADGKLYLNRSMFQRTQWRANKVSYIKQADDAWAKLTGEKAAVPRPEQDATSAAFKTAIFPFNNASPGTAPRYYSEDLGELTHNVIRRNRSLDLIYSYYALQDSVDVIVDAEQIWRGESRRKQPNEELIYELGGELGVDAVLLLQWRSVFLGGNETAWEAEIYLFDIGLRRVHHDPESRLATGDIRVSDIDTATRTVFSGFLEAHNKVSQTQ